MPENQCKCHKEGIIFQENRFSRNIRNYSFKKESVLKIPKILDLENVICIFAFNFANVWMEPEVQFYNIFMYLYNKNILEYAQIGRREPKSMILNIKGRSTI